MTLNSPSNSQLLKPESITNLEHQSLLNLNQEETGHKYTEFFYHPGTDKIIVTPDGRVWTSIAKRTSNPLNHWRELKRWSTKFRNNHLIDIPYSLMHDVEPGTTKRNKSVTAVICLESYLGRRLYSYEQASHGAKGNDDNSYGNLKAQCYLNNCIDELTRNHTGAHTHNKRTCKSECLRAIKRLEEEVLPTL